jgi:hypothetical protein
MGERPLGERSVEVCSLADPIAERRSETVHLEAIRAERAASDATNASFTRFGDNRTGLRIMPSRRRFSHRRRLLFPPPLMLPEGDARIAAPAQSAR